MNIKYLRIFEVIHANRGDVFLPEMCNVILNIFKDMTEHSKWVSIVKIIDFGIYDYCNGNTDKGIQFFQLIDDMFQLVENKDLIHSSIDARYGDIEKLSFRVYIGKKYTDEEHKSYIRFLIFLHNINMNPSKKFKNFVPSEVKDFINL